jgi:nucleoside-diphosphate-sugar epimerase
MKGIGYITSACGPGRRRRSTARHCCSSPATQEIHGDDAAAAAVAALEWPCGVDNVGDDEPATGREWAPVFCAAVGAPPPQAPTRIPGARGADNGRACALGWRPAVPSWRTGFRALAGAAS